MIEKAAVQNLRILVRAYAKATGYSQVKISKQVYGGAHFLAELFAGQRSVSLKHYDKVVTRLQKAWPAGVAWPLTQVIVLKSPVTKVTNCTFSTGKSVQAS